MCRSWASSSLYTTGISSIFSKAQPCFNIDQKKHAYFMFGLITKLSPQNLDFALFRFAASIAGRRPFSFECRFLISNSEYPTDTARLLQDHPFHQLKGPLLQNLYYDIISAFPADNIFPSPTEHMANRTIPS